MKILNVRDLVFTFTLSVAIIGAGTATAMGDGGGSSSDQTSQKCKTGQVWSNTAKKCVKASSGIVPDQELYQAGPRAGACRRI